MDMIFLTIEDLAAGMYQRFIDESTGDGSNVLFNIEQQNISLMKSKLGGRYDVDAIFSATGTDRHPLIVKYLSYLVLYDMIRRNAARKVPSDIKERHEEAMAWLNGVRDNTEFPDLPAISDEDGTDTDVYYGNNRNEDFYL